MKHSEGAQKRMKIHAIALSVAAGAAIMSASSLAQDDARSAYQMRQAVQEVQRLSSQFDQMQNGMESISARMNRLERSNSSGDVKAEIGAIRAELNELKRRQESMRGEIVAEISKKMAELIAKNRPAPPPPPTPSARGGKSSRASTAPQPDAAPTGPTGPYFEHVVEPGETLSYIAKECNTTVHKIKLYSNLKSDNLRVGQKLLIPAEEAKK